MSREKNPFDSAYAEMTLQQAAGYQTLLKKFELLNFSFGFALFLDILLHRVPVGPFSNCRNVISVCPKLTTPKLLFYRWLAPKYFPCGYAFEYLNDPAGRHLRMRPA